MASFGGAFKFAPLNAFGCQARYRISEKIIQRPQRTYDECADCDQMFMATFTIADIWKYTE
ncbi:MAG: hypothetical protein A3I66_07490 [Burkholderiales bacterium RIFCSPLOWO2_02_FULL_57_36]|nr:MAG: hypothetical protein A3I66_07490 [Burkholderiales bacterium RIFCSPLOWO2_02_FULL_57_36]